MKTLKTQLLPRGIDELDDEEGNYYVVDVTMNEQFMVHVYSDGDGNLIAHSSRDQKNTPLEDFNHPNYRWFRIEPLSVKDIEKILVPV